MPDLLSITFFYRLTLITTALEGSFMAIIFRFINQFFRKLFKLINCLRLIILNAIFIFIVLLIVVSFNETEEKIYVADNSYLQINLNGYIVEQRQPADLSQKITNQLTGTEQEQIQEFETQALINTIQHAQHDDKITGLVLELSGLRSASLDQLSDIGDAINEFKKSGKPVYAYADNYSQTQYYLAAYADHITLAPNGLVILQGYAVNRLYFKDLLDELLITPHIFKVGTYKSFVEPFTETKMSQYSKDANKHWLDQLWQGYIDTVLLQRNNIDSLSAQSINPSLDQLKQQLRTVSGDGALYAMSVGLVDELAYHEQFIANLTLKAETKSKPLNRIDYNHYASSLPPIYTFTGSNNQIAVIHGSGEIVSGTSDATTIADKSFNTLLKQARLNKQIKAVVIRLDTPGGSASASELIRQQILALKKQGKTVVVSMGSVTASGGYWIASAADKIIASPTTLTGSIGIFGMFATIDKTLNKIGIHQDGVSTSPLSDVGITQPLNPQLAEIFQIGIEHGYQSFLEVVADGRDMTKQEVDKVAQGRVWTGVDALQLGLVDELGNLQTAINSAAQLASLSEYDIVSIQPEISPKQLFINKLLSQSISFLPSTIMQSSPLIEAFLRLEKQSNFITRLNDPKNHFIYCTQCRIE